MKEKKHIRRSSAQMFQPVDVTVPSNSREASPSRGCGDTNVTVNVTVNEKQEGEVTGCMKSLFGCAKKAAK
jgi:hypothetical protein